MPLNYKSETVWVLYKWFIEASRHDINGMDIQT